MAGAVRVTLELPEAVTEETRAVAQRKAHESAVLAVWEAGEISTRQAAAELGLTYYDYLDLLAARGIPVERGPLDSEAIQESQRTLAERSCASQHGRT